MIDRLPGTTVEIAVQNAAVAKDVLDNAFLCGGLMMSQVARMTGLEPYMIQNWVKRGFMTSPKKRVYTRAQLARVIIINMLRESLQIEKIAGLIKIIGGVLDDETDDLISDDELYHIYVDMLAEGIDINDEASVRAAAVKATESFESTDKTSKEKLIRILEAMLYAHSAAQLRERAEEMLSSLE